MNRIAEMAARARDALERALFGATREERAAQIEQQLDRLAAALEADDDTTDETRGKTDGE